MACNGPTTKRATRNVGTDGSTSGLFNPFLRVRANDIASFRISYDYESASGSGTITVSRAYRTSNDGYTWDAATQIGASYSSSTGNNWGGSYTSSPTDKQWLEIGLLAKNVSAGSPEAVQMKTQIDLIKNG